MSCFQFESRGLAILTLLRHLPEGVAWIAWRVPGKIARKLMDVFADAYEDCTRALCALIGELDPRTTVQMITEWETAVSLPDPCLPTATTLAERRFWVLWRLNKRRFSTEADWHYLASLFNLTIAITPGWYVQRPQLFEYRFPMGFDIFPKLGRFRVYIDITNVAFAGFEYGLAGTNVDVGFPIPFGGDVGAFDQFRCLIERVKPANVVVIWNAFPVGDVCTHSTFSAPFSATFC